MFDFLFRRGNPTNTWRRAPKLTLNVDLLHATINEVQIGQPVEAYSFLGRSSTPEISSLEYYKLGFVLDHEDDGIVSGCQLVFHDFLKKSGSYKGQIAIDGTTIEMEQLIERLGDPYWIFQDDTEAFIYYEYPSHEIEIEHELNGRVNRINVTKAPTMSNPGRRDYCGVTKPWPPF